MPIKKPGEIYFGWWLVIVTAIIGGIGAIFGSQGASVLFKPIATDLGIDRTATSLATSFGNLTNGIAFALAGWLTIRFGPKWVTIAGACLAGTGMILLSQISSPIAYYLIWSLFICSGIALGNTVAIDSSLTNWFVRKRGLAFSVRWGIISLMTAACLPLFSWLIETQGWRSTSIFWGIFVIASSSLFLYFVKQKRPEYYGTLPDGARPQPGADTSPDALLATGMKYAADVQETEYTFRQATRTYSFWMLNAGWGVLMIISTGFNLHVIPFLTDRGIDPVVASSLISMMTLVSMPARIFSSLIADHVKKGQLKFLLVGAHLLMGGGIGIFLLSPTVSSIYILLICYGLGYGIYTPIDTLIRGRYFGRKAYGPIQGLAMLLASPLAFLSPIFCGWIFDSTGSYNTAFMVFTLLGGAGALIMLLSRTPKPLPPDPAGTTAAR